MIAAHRKGRKKPKTQDGRKARRLKRRWKVERCNAWLKAYRRLRVRHEWHVENFLGANLCQANRSVQGRTV